MSFLNWSDTWCLYFNTSKCKIMHAGKKKKKKNPDVNYKAKVDDQDLIIAKWDEEKDQGVTFDKLLKFDVHIQSYINKANKSLSIIKRSFLYQVSEFLLDYMNQTLVRPKILTIVLLVGMNLTIKNR